jgi:hypothetical protein
LGDAWQPGPVVVSQPRKLQVVPVLVVGGDVVSGDVVDVDVVDVVVDVEAPALVLEPDKLGLVLLAVSAVVSLSV